MNACPAPSCEPTDPSSGFSPVDLADLGRDTAQRRAIVAYFMACPAAARPSSDALATLLGVSAGTIRTDWARSDVRALARSATSAGLVAVILAAARSCVLALAARAKLGDVDASRELRAWLLDLGALQRTIAPEGTQDDAGGDHGAGSLADPEAVEALRVALAAARG